MDTGPQEGQHHSPAEAEHEINALPDAFWIRLRRWTTWRLLGNCVAEADEVIADVYERFSRGTRKWPVGVPMDSCFWNAVKSVISGEWAKHKNYAAKHISDLPEEFAEAGSSERTPLSGDDPLVTLEERPELMRQQQIVDHIYDAFVGDKAVTAVLEGLERNTPARDIQRASGLTDTQYDSARKRLRRFINRHYPNGWRPHGKTQQESESLA